MSFANPTSLRLGMTGTLAGTQFRVAGRVVLGMDDGGETYYWNEFNLVDDAGDSATLVYEETERGGEWRLFKYFEPQSAMTATEAVAKRVGDRFNFGEGEARITLVDESRVYFIEGPAPEGVEVGDIARYFNALAGNKTIVVSWTGNEVEYYRGMDLSRGTVMAAFGLRAESPGYTSSFSSSLESSSADDRPGVPAAVKVIATFLVLVILLASYASCGPKRQRSAVTRTAAPAAPLNLGAAGRLEGKQYRVASRAVVEIAQTGRVYGRHEFELLDEGGDPALLVFGSKTGENPWVLFRPMKPLDPLTPQQAAALRVGETVNLSGYIARVADLFQRTVQQVESDSTRPPSEKSGDLSFGFNAQSGSTPLLVVWNQTGIAFYSGKSLSAKDISESFNLNRPKAAP